MRARFALGLAAAIGLAAAPMAAQAQAPEYGVQALADRAMIEDLLTRYYNNFGGGTEHKFGEFYAPDGEMILGDKHYKGIEAIEGMYASVPADAPQKKSFALNILINNMLVLVHGDTASARLVFTETVIDKQGDAPRLLTQGREFDRLVKRDGKWLISSRTISGAKGVPEGWED